MRDTVGETLYRTTVASVSLLPKATAYRGARALGGLEYRVRGRRVKLRPELLQALEATPAQVAAWTRRSCELSVSEDVDYYRRLWGRSSSGDIIELRGLDHLDAALAGGRGAILYSGHIRGPWMFFCGLTALGYPVHLISCHPSDQLAGMTLWCYGRHLTNLQDRMGLRYVWVRPGNFGVAVQAANVLRRNAIVALTIDPLGASTIDVDVLGQRAEFSSGHALLAQATGAPLLDFFVHRDDDWHQVGEIGSPLDASDDVRATVQESVDRIAGQARRHPEEWYFWS